MAAEVVGVGVLGLDRGGDGASSDDSERRGAEPAEEGAARHPGGETGREGLARLGEEVVRPPHAAPGGAEVHEALELLECVHEALRRDDPVDDVHGKRAAGTFQARNTSGLWPSSTTRTTRPSRPSASTPGRSSRQIRHVGEKKATSSEPRPRSPSRTGAGEPSPGPSPSSSSAPWGGPIRASGARPGGRARGRARRGRRTARARTATAATSASSGRLRRRAVGGGRRGQPREPVKASARAGGSRSSAPRRRSSRSAGAALPRREHARLPPRRRTRARPRRARQLAARRRREAARPERSRPRRARRPRAVRARLRPVAAQDVGQVGARAHLCAAAAGKTSPTPRRRATSTGFRLTKEFRRVYRGSQNPYGSTAGRAWDVSRRCRNASTTRGSNCVPACSRGRLQASSTGSRPR